MRSRSAIFLSPSVHYHADRCDPLVTANARGVIRLEALARRGYPGRKMPSRMLPEVSTVGFWDAPANQTWGLDWHRNEGIELTYLASGKLDFAVDGKHYPLEAGHLTITRPWQLHRVGQPAVQASRLHWLILDLGVRRPNQEWKWPSWLILAPADRDRLTGLLRHNEHPVWTADRDVARCFGDIGKWVVHADPLAVETRLKLCLNELFVCLLEMLLARNMELNTHLSTTRRTVEMFLESLPAHLDHLWTLEEMARQCGLGRTRFARYCRQITNRSPIELLTHLRIEAACQKLLKEPHRSVTEIAFACGFNSHQYFTTVFRRHTGHSPQEYRVQLDATH